MVKINMALERGKRLRTLREQTGLTRSQFANEVNISEHTLKSFELGTRVLSAHKAKEYSEIFIFAGLDVSFDFLYYGNKFKSHEQNEVAINDDMSIQNEIIFFKKNNPSSIILKIQDCLMSPFYNKGDIVGGQKILDKSQYLFLKGYVCIIESTHGNQTLRRILKVDNRKIISCILNTDSSHNSPIVEETEAFSIAQATRHWRLSEIDHNLHTTLVARTKKPLSSKIM
ncbi:MAG: helix-turn-helix domain-containing protein [Candidatus Paracaedibacter sp.]